MVDNKNIVKRIIKRLDFRLIEIESNLLLELSEEEAKHLSKDGYNRRNNLKTEKSEIEEEIKLLKEI